MRRESPRVNRDEDYFNGILKKIKVKYMAMGRDLSPGGEHTMKPVGDALRNGTPGTLGVLVNPCLPSTSDDKKRMIVDKNTQMILSLFKIFHIFYHD